MSAVYKMFTSQKKKIIIFKNPYYKSYRISTLADIIRSKIHHNEINFKYKRSHISYYHFIQFLHLNFYKITTRIKYKRSNLFSKIKKKLEKLSFNHLTYKLLFDQKFTSNFLKLILLTFIVIFLYNKILKEQDKIIEKSDNMIKSLIINKVCLNKIIIEKISWEILVLCKQDRTHRLIRNLILNEVLKNKEITMDLYRLIKREIIAYIKSEDCRRQLKNLIAKDVMQNSEVRSELYSLIRQFITLKEVDFLEDKLEKILVDVLNIKGIHDHVGKKMESEINKALRDDKLINMVIEMLMDKFK